MIVDNDREDKNDAYDVALKYCHFVILKARRRYCRHNQQTRDRVRRTGKERGGGTCGICMERT